MKIVDPRACPDCGDVAPLALLYNPTRPPCPRCRLRRGMAAALAKTNARERHCPACELTVASGSWALHERSKMHRLNVRLVLGALTPPAELGQAVTA